MKKMILVGGYVVIMAVAGYSIWKILKSNNYGKSETNPSETGNPLEEKTAQGTEETGA